MLQAAESLIGKNGGVQGLVDQFEKIGLGGVARSWVGTGENLTISADQIQKTLGPDAIRVLAQKAGISPDELASKLSSILPGVVDKLTPSGKVN